MKSIFMRVLFFKIHCPSFICFCKPSAATHLYNPGPLKLENSPHVPSAVVSVAPDASVQLSSVVELTQVKEKSLTEDAKQEEAAECVLRSCIKKAPSKSASPKPVEKKKVQWMDSLGKELVDIKEFESSETGDTDNEEEGRGCLCNIL